ncbi:BolA family protein [Tateyamaria omphalii]|uniref:BolA family transcriptional regulator n=1 Tax=Tateyamaria omphalii TaxID=299262 RepID=A0A1P8N0J6_9RHOB|nr:BolA/IbaG family iron-sulfur metabolism protein [Tateyamaria omphalii]APX13793.1 BolA family transcriptional regulator [Tateyamaria omphalii]
MTVRQEIEDKLRAAFQTRDIQVVDDSASHAGHAGAPAAGQSHFNVMLRSPEFAGKNRIARHRAVHAALGPDLIGRIHALALDLDV